MRAEPPEVKPHGAVIANPAPVVPVVAAEPLRVKLPEHEPRGPKQASVWRAMKWIHDWGSEGIPVGLSNEDVLRLVNKELPKTGNKEVALETVRRVRMLCR